MCLIQMNLNLHITYTNLIFIIVSIYELLLLLILAYNQSIGITKRLKFIFRHLLLYPLILFIIYITITKSTNIFNIFMLCSFIVIILSDSFIIYNFNIGIFLFGLCHIINGINFTIYNTNLYFISLIIGFIFFILNVFLYRILYRVINKKTLKIILFIYMLIIFYSVFKGIDLLLQQYTTKTLLIALGSILFWICDVQIAGYQFIKENENYKKIFEKIRKYMFYINAITYYTALTLLAFSTWF